MDARETKIACQVTARMMTAYGIDLGYRIFQNNLILWAEGRTRSNVFNLKEVAALKDDVMFEVKDEAGKLPFYREMDSRAFFPQAFKATDKAVFMVAEIWLPIDRLDLDQAEQELRQARWREAKPKSRG